MAENREERRKFGGVTKDPLDLRDLMYEPSLEELPFKVDNRDKVPWILNQGQEGACTGFGLAAAVNFLFQNRADDVRIKESVSARMLYEMAKRFDEWEGENYAGSSIRGAMKGWHKHGVCLETDWPYKEDDAGRFTAKRQVAALPRRLGAYFRVRHLHLNHMHSALNEVGILYASARVHKGWYEVDRRTGKIPFRRAPAGGHAFAIVGYDGDGFWIQNSWGPRWGKAGFCHISYEDWLENGDDCWVARLGVPTARSADEDAPVVGREATFDYVPHEAAALSRIRPHFVNLGNDGNLSTSGRYTTSHEDVREIIAGSLKARARQWGGTAKLLLYAHGGLNDEKQSAARIARMLPTFLDNHIYPLHFMWETSLPDSIRGIVEDAFRHGRFTGWFDDMKDKFRDLLDEAVELGARQLGPPVWNQMKDNALRASTDPDGGAAFVAGRIAELRNGGENLELHLVGHSAGAVFHCHLVRKLSELGLLVKTLTLFAPACTTELYRSNVGPLLRSGDIQRLTIFNLTDRYELDDSVVSVYGKSLLYLVSAALESSRGEPLLGLDKFARNVVRRNGSRVISSESSPAVIRSIGGDSRIRLVSQSTTHGGFDDDQDTLNSTLRIIRGSNRLSRKF